MTISPSTPKPAPTPTPATAPEGSRSSALSRLTGQSRLLAPTGRRGQLPRGFRRGRPKLHPSYAADRALLNSPAKRWWTLALVAIAVIAPFAVEKQTIYLLTMAVIMAIAGIGLNLITGYAGQISLGHPFFMALGAYTAAVVTGAPGKRTYGWGLDLAIALPAAAVVPAVVGLVVAPLAMRVRGLYLAILTLGLLMVGAQVFKQWVALTGGSGVGRKVAQPVLFGTDLSKTYAIGPVLITKNTSLYLMALVLLIGLAVVARNLARSRTGRAFAAVRDRDIAAEIMGVPLLRTKTIAFMLSSAYAGVAGALLSLLVGQIAPEQWDIFMAIEVLAIIVIGGVATVSGSIIGAAFVVLLPKLLEMLAPILPGVGPSGQGLISVFQLQTMLFGVLIIVFLVLEPRGLFGLWYRIRTYFATWPFRY